MNTIIKILICIAIVLFFTSIIKIAIARNEKVECNKLASYALEYKDFYYTEEQSIMCGLGRD